MLSRVYIIESLPSIEASNSIFAHDICDGSCRGGFLALLRFELNDNFCHIYGLNDAGCDHSG